MMPVGGQSHDLAHILAHRGVPGLLQGPRQLDALGAASIMWIIRPPMRPAAPETMALTIRPP